MNRIRTHRWTRAVALLLVFALWISPFQGIAFGGSGVMPQDLDPLIHEESVSETGTKAAAIDPALEKQIREDYFAYQKDTDPDNDWIQNLSLEHVSVDHYFGKQSGYEMVSMAIDTIPEDAMEDRVPIAGFTFIFPSGQAHNRLFAYQDGQFTQFETAYREGLLTDADIYNIGVNGSKVLGFHVYNTDGFTDLSADEWYDASVKYCVRRNLFAGVSDTAFSPNATMTRGMFVTVLAKVMLYLSHQTVDLEGAFES